MTPFAHCLRLHLRRRGLSQKAFSRRVSHSYPFINKVLLGKRGPPDDVVDWARALGLSSSEQEEFLILAAIARTPVPVQQLLMRYERATAECPSISIPAYLSRYSIDDCTKQIEADSTLF